MSRRAGVFATVLLVGAALMLTGVPAGAAPPTAVDDSYTTRPETLSVPAPGFLTNDTDPDGDPLTAVSIVDDVDHGILAAFAEGSFTYTPDPGFVGTDSFEYRMRDAENNFDTAIVTIDVVNNTPVAVDDAYTTRPETLTVAAPGFLTNDTDPDGDPLTAVSIVDTPDHGILAAFAEGSFTYTPDPGFVGTDTFEYRMRDSYTATDTAIVTIDVVNNTPVAVDDTYTARPETLNVAAPGFLTNDTDPDGDPLTAISIVDSPDHGILAAFANGSFTYTPDPGYLGTDTFEYRMWDSYTATDTAIVTIEIVNNTPVAVDDLYATPEDTPLAVAAPGFLTNDTDADGDPLSAISIVDSPDHGILAAFANGSFTYTPDPGYTGTDAFEYRMWDSYQADDTAIVTIFVTNDPPVAVDDAYEVLHDETLTVPAPGVLGNDTDPDGDPLTLDTITDDVDHGTLTTGPDGSFTYTPDPSYAGPDTFTYRTTDGIGSTDTAVVTVNVTNDAPVAVDDAYEILHDETLTVPAPGVLGNDTDPDGDPLTLDTITDDVDHGTLTTNPDGSFTYTPDPAYAGPDTFTYRTTDGIDTDQATVTLTVTNTAPDAISDNYATETETPLTVPAPGVLGNDTDPDGDPLTLDTITDDVDHGTLTTNPDGSFTYTPDPAYAGPDTFTYRTTDGIDSDQATVAITVTNEAAVAVDDTYEILHDETLTVPAPGVLGNDTDPDGDPLTLDTITDDVDHGTLTTGPDGSFTYTPDPGYAGPDMFEYRVTDPYGAVDTGIVSLFVTNEPPQAVDDSYEILHGEALTVAAPGVLGNDTDPDGDPLTLDTITDDVDHGTLTTNPDGSFTYTPDPGYAGPDTFTYRTTDGIDSTDTAMVTLTVTNTAPDAVDDAYETPHGEALTVAAPGVLGNDTDPDGDPLTLDTITDDVDHGTLTTNPDGSFTYTPDPGYAGPDTFTYRTTDGVDSTDTAMVTITVGAADEPTTTTTSTTTPTSTSTPGGSPTSTTPTVDAAGETLPATGSAAAADAFRLGSSLVVAGGALLLASRRRARLASTR